MPDRTKGQIESQISEAIVRFEKEHMGRGPAETKTYILDDMIFVRMKGVLTPAEEQLAKTNEGAGLIKKTRMLLLEGSRMILERLILEITGSQIISLHTDISMKTGERIIVLTLDQNLEEKFAKKTIS